MERKHRFLRFVQGICCAGLCALLLMPGASWAADLSPQNPSKGDKCPVCGMFVSKYPDWVAQILFKDGKAVFFDGAKDMFKYYFDLKRYAPDRRLEDIGALYVTEYYGIKPFDARQAHFVVGSDVYGPMGRELIPFASRADAETFETDHKGKAIFAFEEVIRKIVESLD